MDLSQSGNTWCIEDTLFYPMGLINHTTGNKTVFVTWNEKYLMTFIFKKVAENTNRKQFIIKIMEEIIDIIILEVNTLLLLKNGEVCYFASIKSIHGIPWLKTGVRCVSRSLIGFSLIRVHEDNRISLELYQDIPNLGKTSQDCTTSFDLTFDEKNLLNSDWSDEKLTLVSIPLNESNHKLMELVVREQDLQVNEIHIFSMGNQLFALLPKNGEDYEIKILAPQVSPIELVKFLEQSNMLLIFLSCGIIEVWYLSKVAPVLEKYTYINGNEIVHHTFAGEVLFFTDEQKISRLEFIYDSMENTCQVIEQSIHAPGMVAITYVEENSNLVCLSHNNIFYQLTFDAEQHEQEFPKKTEIFELTNAKVKEMMSKTDLLREITSLPQQLEKSIEEEYKKQELIAVCRKSSIYTELISASIAFTQHIPQTPELLIYPCTSGMPPFNYFAIVSIKIIPHEIFKSTMWSLMISYFDSIRLVSITSELLQQKFSILVPIGRKEDELIPKFIVQLLTYVKMEQDFVCINIPVKIVDLDMGKTFSLNRGLRQLSLTPQLRSLSFTFKICCSQLHTRHIFEAFDIPETNGTNENLVDEVLVEDLYFLGEKVVISFCESTNTITLESLYPVALYYAKICFNKYLREKFKRTADDYAALRRNLLEMQCHIEKKYGTLNDCQLHLENLKRTYEKLRKHFAWSF